MKKSASKKTGKEECYGNSLEHLFDELKRIDLLLDPEVRKVRAASGPVRSGEYAGLYISEEEIDGIMGGASGTGGTAAPSPDPATETDKGLKELFERISRKKAASLAAGIELPLNELCRTFNLSQFEMDCLLVCLAPELDLKYERLYGYLQNDVTKKRPTVEFVLNLLCRSIEEKTMARYFLSVRAPLLRHGILTLSNETKDGHHLGRSLGMDGRTVDFLHGLRVVDARISSCVEVVLPKCGLEGLFVPAGLRRGLEHFCSRLMGCGDDGGAPGPLIRSVFYHKGPKGSGQRRSAEAVCYEVGLLLLVIDMDAILACGLPIDLCLRLVFREALFQSSAVYFKGFDRLLEYADKVRHIEEVFLDFVEKFPAPVFLEGERDWRPRLRDDPAPFFVLTFSIPMYELRRSIWNALLKDRRVERGVEIDAIANKFQFTEGQIKDAIWTAGNLALARDSGASSITTEDLYHGCRASTNQSLNALARKIQPRYGWDDIVLPGEKVAQLKEISNYVRHRQVVYGDWGFGGKLSLGKGLNAVFHGSSGTGKTMAAEVIAKDLGLDLYKIDLSTVVSKYIGETEKNLSMIFKEAETSNSIIFFDEADALFGKRSEVKDAHDRYANIEVGYLLQKMEEYEGVAILATNLMKNMDEAFVRRMHFIVEFPFPDEAERLHIWKGIFPDDAPCSEDIDFEFLSRSFKIAGGNIKNVVLTAAFLAAENSGRIGMEHIITATRREFQKIGKLCMESDFGKYHGMNLHP